MSVKAHTDHQQRYPWSALLFQGQLESKLATVRHTIKEHVFVNGNYLLVTSSIPAIQYTGYALIHTITNTGICQYCDTTKYRYTAQLYITAYCLDILGKMINIKYASLQSTKGPSLQDPWEISSQLVVVLTVKLLALWH